MLIVCSKSYTQSMVSKLSSNCTDFRILKIPCTEMDSINRSLLFYPILKRENTVLTTLLKHNNELYKAEKDSISTVFFKQKKAIKRAKVWGNTNATLVSLLGIFLILK